MVMEGENLLTVNVITWSMVLESLLTLVLICE